MLFTEIKADIRSLIFISSGWCPKRWFCHLDAGEISEMGPSTQRVKISPKVEMTNNSLKLIISISSGWCPKRSFCHLDAGEILEMDISTQRVRISPKVEMTNSSLKLMANS